MTGPLKSDRGRLRRAIVVGAGRAGLAATLELAERGVPVLLISGARSLQARSARDREGFNAAMLGRDSVERHTQDTEQSAAGLVGRDAVWSLCARAPKLVEWLSLLGVPFTREASGELSRVQLRGSSEKRTAHVAASTGRHIISALDALAHAAENTPARDESGISVPGEKLVKRLDYWRFCCLVLDDHGSAIGVLAQDCRTLAIKALPADGVILATGDYTGLFGEAVAGSSSTGAALGAVYRQGAVLSNLEFVDHHPLVVVKGGVALALPELLRAKGARLSARDKLGEDAQRLDLGALDSDQLAPLLGSLGSAFTQLLGVDPAREDITVRRRPYHGLGGLWVDGVANGAGFSPRSHATSIPGLYAAGAAAAQYHGASALPGNLAPADLHGGQMAARGVVCYRESLEKSAFDLPKSLFEKPASVAEAEFEQLFKQESKGSNDGPHTLLAELREQMALKCGARRDAEGLEELEQSVARLLDRSKQVSVNGPTTGWNQDALALASLGDALILAKAVVSSALARQESRGAHIRSDFGKARAGEGKCSLSKLTADGEPEPIDGFDYTSAGESVRVAL